MWELSDTRLIYVAPSPGSGVGDYAADFAAGVRPHFKEVIQFQLDSDGGESVRDVVRNVRRIRALANQTAQKGPTIVHFEQRAGALAAFWGSILPRRIPVAATIHDAPQPVWFPFETAVVGRNRVLHHGLHYPFRFAVNALQRRVCNGRIVMVLSSVGATNFKLRQPGSDPRAARIFIPSRPPVKPVTSRPLAVGLFGHVYKGKGFEQIAQLREALDRDIHIMVAGRGTEALPSGEGVTVLGEVNGTDEDRFFESIRFLVVPYAKDNIYGRAFPASSAAARSFSYTTPILCTMDGALAEMATEGGAVGCEGGIAAIAQRANVVVRDDDVLSGLADEVSQLQRARTLENCVHPFLQAWTELHEKQKAHNLNYTRQQAGHAGGD